MTYMDKYPLYIKSVDYGDLDVPEDQVVDCVVTYADDSVKHYTTKADLLAVHEQLTAQAKALAAGEVISYVKPE